MRMKKGKKVCSVLFMLLKRPQQGSLTRLTLDGLSAWYNDGNGPKPGSKT